MILHEQPTYYDTLEISPDASPQEIRDAYLRAKAAYKKDSVALYTLISEDETESLLARIEEAYQVLSNPDRRREYDRKHGILGLDESPAPGMAFGSAPRHHEKIVSIDRVPPMEKVEDESDLLIPPTTDFTVPGQTHGSLPGASHAGSQSQSSYPSQSRPQAPSGPFHNPPASPIPVAPSTPVTMLDILREIEQEVEWRGSFFRKVRETRGISLEELSVGTKISKTYITAIEEENFERLPAPVYLRGFVIQIARALKVPHEKASTAYMARYNQVRSSGR